MNRANVMALARRYRPDALAALGLLAIVVLLFSDTIIPLRALVFCGDFPLYYTYEMAFRAGLAHGTVPLWNPYFVDPLIGSPQSEVLYPGMVLLRWIPLPAAFTWGAGLHIWLAGLGVFSLLRDLNARRPAAFLSAISYMLSATMLEHLIAGHTTQVDGMVWLAWILLCYRRLLLTRRWRYVVATTVTTACFALTGHIQWVLIGAAVVVAYGLFVMAIEAWRKDWHALGKSALTSAAAALFAAGLAAVFALPAAEYVSLSTRGIGLSFAEATDYSVTPVELVTLPAPQARIAAGGDVTAADETLAYTGLIVLGLAALAIFSPVPEHRRLAWLLVGLDAVALLLSLGRYVPLYRLVYAITDSMRAPSRYLLVWAFCTPLLAGLGLESLLRRVEAGLPARSWLLWGALGISVLVVVGSAMAGPIARPAALVVAGIAIVAWGAALIMRRWLSSQRWAWLMAAAMLVDMLSFAWLLAAPGVMNSVEYYDLFFKPQTNTYLAFNVDPGEVRLWGGDGGEPWTVAPAFGLPVIGRDIQGTSHFVADLIGPSPHEALISAAGYQVVTGAPPPGSTVIGQSGDTRLVELDGNLPRVYATGEVRAVKSPQRSLKAVTNAQFDPRQETIVLDPDGQLDVAGFSGGRADVRLTGYQPDIITTHVNADGRVMVVFVEPYYPGWVAEIDGSPAEIWQVNHAFRGVVVPAGSHTVTMTYQPDSVRNGAWISGVALVLLALGSIVAAKRRPRAAPAEKPDPAE